MYGPRLRHVCAALELESKGVCIHLYQMYIARYDTDSDDGIILI